jgi:CRP-like cAMP-binding protein
MSSIVSNRLLASLSEEASKAITSRCVAVPLSLSTPLYAPLEFPKHVFFITSGIASVVAEMVDGGTSEVEIVGREGVVGSLHMLGTAPVQTRCFIQMAGTGLRMEASELKGLFNSHNEIRARVLELVQTQVLTVSQLSACNRLHEAEARLARWLLMAQDRTGSDLLKLTQEFLAQMLGTQRTTVSISAGVLQRIGLIQYRHGQVRILNREGLTAAACDCYRIVSELQTRLYTKPWS